MKKFMLITHNPAEYFTGFSQYVHLQSIRVNTTKDRARFEFESD